MQDILYWTWEDFLLWGGVLFTFLVYLLAAFGLLDTEWGAWKNAERWLERHGFPADAPPDEILYEGELVEEDDWPLFLPPPS